MKVDIAIPGHVSSCNSGYSIIIMWLYSSSPNSSLLQPWIALIYHGFLLSLYSVHSQHSFSILWKYVSEVNEVAIQYKAAAGGLFVTML